MHADLDTWRRAVDWPSVRMPAQLFLKAATKSFRRSGLLLLMVPIRKSLAEGTCLPFQTSRNISFEALKKQSASLSGLPGVISHLSGVRATVHFSSSPREK